MLYDIVVLLGMSVSLAASGYTAYQKFQPLRWIENWLKTLPGKMKRLFMWLFKEIFRGLKKLWKMIKGVGGKIKKVGEDIIRKLKAGFLMVIRKIEKGVKGAIKSIKKGGQKVIRDIDRGGKKVIRKIGGAVNGAVKKVAGAGKQVINSITNGGKAMIRDIGRAGEKIFNDIKRKVNEAIRAVGRFATDAINKVRELFNKAFEAIKKAAYAVRDAALAAARWAREQALAAARAARAAAQAAARAAREAAEAVARRAREAANAVGSGVRSVGNFFCFSRNTPIKLLDGRVILMKDIKIGDVLINGVTVQATMQIQSSQDDPFYKIYSEEIKDYIYVTGSHHIQNGDKYVLVRDFDKSEKLDTVDDELCCLVTSDHTIPIGEFTFWDWEDNLL